MASFQKYIALGNLTRDPQLKYLPSSMAVCEFGIAMNHKFKTADGQEREDVVFIDCAAYGKTGETINQYFAKGKPILIEGRLKLDSWEDKQGGGKRSKHSVVIESFRFVGPREDGDNKPQDRGQDRSSGYKRPAQKPAPENPIGDEGHFKEDDIPF